MSTAGGHLGDEGNAEGRLCDGESAGCHLGNERYPERHLSNGEEQSIICAMWKYNVI